MTLYFAGDVHGDTYFDKMRDPALMALSKEDHVIVCGDLEVLRPDPDERAWCIERLENMPYTTLFVDGNHEGHELLNACPRERWHGGFARRVSESILYLERGQVFDIGGFSVLAMGGAKTFAGLREAGLLDGPDPGIPTEAERRAAVENLLLRGSAVDFVASHTAPSRVIGLLPQRENTPTSEFTDWLQELADTAHFKQWLFGHYHCDAEPLPGFRCLLNSLYRADDGAVLRDPVIEPQKGRRKGRVQIPGRLPVDC